MSRTDLISIFEDVTRRIDAGESPEDVLRDYPEYADELRRLLASSQRQPTPRTPSKNKAKRTLHNDNLSRYRLPLVAMIALLLLGGFAFVLQSPQSSTPVTAQTTADCVAMQRENPYLNQQSSMQNQTSSDSAAESVRRTGGSTDMAMPSSADGAGAASPSVAVEESAELDDDRASREFEAAPPADADTTGGDVMTQPRPEPTPVRQQQQSAPLRAGEIDDNAKWEEYLTYRTEYLARHASNSVDDVDISGRRLIQVTDQNGDPIPHACVRVYHGETLVSQSLTYADGLTLFFPNANEQTRYVESFEVEATYNGETSRQTLDRDDYTTLTLTLPVDSNPTPQLDVVFLLDATGSMGDEIRQLQDNILSISSRVDEQNLDVRYGLIAYRDRGDAYITRQYEFVQDVQTFQTTLDSVQAGGGGDTPESLNQGLYEAVHNMDWQGNLRLTFLLADAPPQLNYQNDISYSLTMQDALTQGIKIHTIASSNTNDAAEYIMRQISQYTMGKFIFLTYDDGVPGTPGDERPDLDVGDPKDEQGVGDYSVSQLDDLVLKLILDEIALFENDTTQP